MSPSALSSIKRAAPDALDGLVPRKRPSWRLLFNTASYLAAPTALVPSTPKPSVLQESRLLLPLVSDITGTSSVHHDNINHAMY